MSSLPFYPPQKELTMALYQTIRNGGATGDDVQQRLSSPFRAATDQNSSHKTNQVPALDSISNSLSLPSTPTLLTAPPDPSSIRNCGSCTQFNDRGIMRICRPCYDLDSIPAISATGAEGITYAEPAFASPGVLAVILVLLFLVAVALVDLSEWVWNKLHRRSIALPECEKGEIFLEESGDSYDSEEEDERLIP